MNEFFAVSRTLPLTIKTLPLTTSTLAQDKTRRCVQHTSDHGFHDFRSQSCVQITCVNSPHLTSPRSCETRLNGSNDSKVVADAFATSFESLSYDSSAHSSARSEFDDLLLSSRNRINTSENNKISSHFSVEQV